MVNFNGQDKKNCQVTPQKFPHQLSANFPLHQLIKMMIIFQWEREGAPHIIKRCQNILQDLSINIVIDRHAAKRRNFWDWRILNVDSLFTEMPRGKIIKDLIFNLRIMIKITLYGWIEWAFKSLCSTRCSAEVTKAFNEIKTSEKLVFLLITCHLLRSILFSLSLF